VARKKQGQTHLIEWLNPWLGELPEHSDLGRGLFPKMILREPKFVCVDRLLPYSF